MFPRPSSNGGSADSAALEFKYTESPFTFSVVRKENGEVLFDTTGTELIFETQYLGLRTSLPDNPNLYGLGEHSDSFRFSTTGYSRTLWNSENPNIPNGEPLYGSHPVYFDHRGDKGTHGVFLLNTNGMKVDIDRDEQGQYLEYNTIGGVIDLYFLAGRNPADVSRQYADTVGYSPMYPYWAFGFHQCRYGYQDVYEVAEVVANYSTAGIPLEVMWTDIDYMDRRQNFITDPERYPVSKMRDLITTLHSRDQKYIVIIDPGIHAVSNYETYASGHNQDVFLQFRDGSDYLGVQWPGAVAWPDWLAENTNGWWSNEITTFFNPENGVDIDGIWVDMNEASNFCPDITCEGQGAYQYAEANNVPPDPPPVRGDNRPEIPGFPTSFQPGSSGTKLKKRRVNPNLQPPQFGQSKGTIQRDDILEPRFNINGKYERISDKTIWVNTTNADGTLQYDTHNLYGYMMADSTHSAMLARKSAKRPVVITRSTFAGIGRKAAHWFGDNASRWDHYRTSIRQMLSFVSMHQMPMVGSDVCGFNENANATLCSRWAMLGAFQPFYRNHAEYSTSFQEFYRWEVVTNAAKKAIDTRYKLLDYAYTALFYQTKEGKPMINPMFFLFPNDPQTFGIETQWFYGDALLISPVVMDESDMVNFYLPQGVWYDYWSRERIESAGQTQTQTNLSLSDIPVHIRGGTIIPERANSANTTKLLRQEDFVLIVAPDADNKASGRLYLDDGESIEQPGTGEITFNYDGNTVTMGGASTYTAQNGESTRITRIIVLGDGQQQEQEGSWELGEGAQIAIGN